MSINKKRPRNNADDRICIQGIKIAIKNAFKFKKKEESINIRGDMEYIFKNELLDMKIMYLRLKTNKQNHWIDLTPD